MAQSIRLKLFATLANRLPDNAEHYPIPAGGTVQDLIDSLALSAEEARLIFINGRRVAPDARLQPGDQVGIFPPVGGG